MEPWPHRDEKGEARLGWEQHYSRQNQGKDLSFQDTRAEAPELQKSKGKCLPH
jgi:hypothetical protein